MSLQGLMQKLADNRVEVWLEDGKLRYRAPKQSMTEALMAELKANKQALIDHLETQQQQPFALTYGQRALWFLYQTAPNSAAYNVAFSARILSAVDTDKMNRALLYLAGRHPALKLRFQEQAGEPEQFISPEAAVDFQVIDGTAWSEESLQQQVNQSYETPFNLNNQQPLFRVRLFERSPQQTVLLLVFHHIIGDGWSLWLLLDELAQVYSALASGRQPELPALSLSYRQFAEQQVARVDAGELEQDWHYWREKFAQTPPLLSLPAKRPFPAQRSYRGASYPLRIDNRTLAALKSLAAELGVTLYVLLFSAYQLLLHRCGGQQQLCVGTPLAGRDDDRYAEVVGYFVNPLPLLSELNAEQTVADFIKACRQEVLSAMAHQAFPLALILERLSLSRDTSRPPLFQAAFVFQQLQKAQQLLDTNTSDHTADKTVDWGGLSLAPYTLFQQEGQFDLSLELMEAGGDLIGSIKFNTDILDVDDAQRLADYYLNILMHLPDYKDSKAVLVPLLNEAYQQQLLQDWNDTAYSYPYTLIPELLSCQAQQTPDAIALVYEQTELTYAELEQRSNRLAHYLTQQGVGIESLVAVCMERCLEMVISLHAIVKAGAAYVPLDPDYPQERLDYMIANAGAELCLTDKLGDYPGRLLCVEDLQTELAQQPSTALELKLQPDNIAYLIYTSGSTGQPKGVANNHQALANRINWMQRAYGLNQHDTVLQKTPYSFDVSVWEFFWPLITGAKLVIAKPNGHKDSHYLAQLIQTQQINTLHFVPSMLQAFIEEPEAAHCASLKRIICSGEALPLSLQQQVYGKLDAQLYNLYGPTEAAIDVSEWPCQEDDTASSIVAIGKPIDNIQLYILDSQLQPVPVGVSGELYIAGIGLARGYHRKAQLTAERFIPNPFGQGERMYRTGDICRYRADGVTEYQGREDGQVKLRGFRIELGEIEAVLKKHQAVQNCVLTADQFRGEKALLAYITLADDVENTPALIKQIREFIQGFLPDYMLPAGFMVLPELPLSSNGKVDRKALPAMELVSQDEERTAPENEAQQRIADIWQQLLKHRDFGIHTNFFHVGGHSLLALRLIAKLTEAFETKLSIEDVFNHSTIDGLSRLLAVEDQHYQAWPAILVQHQDHAPLAFSQERLWFVNTLENAAGVYHIPLAFHLRGQLNKQALTGAIEDLVTRHRALRTKIVGNGHSLEQQVLAGVDHRVSFYSEDQVKAKGLEHIVRQEANATLDLSIGQVFKAALLDVDKQHSLLLLVMHHIISDGWSVNVLLHDLSALYRQRLQNGPTRLPDLPVQYTDYCRWQRQLSDEGWFNPARDYWLSALQDAPTTLTLNYDHSRPMLPTFRGAMLFSQIPAEIRASLQAYAQQRGATDFMLLLSAFSVLLYRYSGQQDFMIGTPVANRDKLELHDLVGLFVNTLLMRIKIDSNQSFEQLLDAVKTTALGAYEHQYYPFEGLVEALQPERNLAVTPLFQVMFVYQGQEQQAFSLAGLDVQPMVLPSATAKCDLTLYVTEEADHWSLAMEYSTDLFEQAGIEQLLSAMTTVLDEVAKNPALPVARIPLLTTAQQTKVLKEWNDTAYSYPDTLIPELLSRQAQQTPDAIALVYEQTELTYAELELRSNRLAHYLRHQGVGIESLVAVCMERCLEMAISLHAIVKAGAAYVPLDPDYPQERLDYMIANAGAEICLTQQALTAKLGDYPGRVVCIEALQSELAKYPGIATELKLQPDNIAYLIYTSGSTGQPKGVANNHQALANRINWMQRAYGLNRHDTVLQKTPYSFDVSVWEFFWPLITGAKLVIAKPNGHKDSHYLAQLIQTRQINTLHFVPSMLQAFIEEPEAAHCTSLDRIICSGEALPLSLQQQVQKTLKAQLYNLYGPTEAAIDVSEWPCQEDDTASSIVAIGKPIDNIQLYILDSQLQPVPIGVSGELYIAGIGLAIGYHRKAGLTAERFVPNPHGQGERMYRTGDICKYRPDGVIDYLGREDGQVKLRGFRIELGEIESVLKQFPTVQHSVVITAQYKGDKALLAYIVLSEPTEDDAQCIEKIRAFLQSRLPSFMVPVGYKILPELPLSANGKIDRKALPAMTVSVEVDALVEPETESQRRIARIWQQQLKHTDFGIHTDFFHAGGNSLLALRLIADLAAEFGKRIRVEDVFTYSSIAGQAQFLEADYKNRLQDNLPDIKTSAEDRAKLTFAQERLWFLNELDSATTLYHIPLIFRLRGALNQAALSDAVADLVKRHPVLRSKIRERNGQLEQQILADLNENIKVYSAVTVTSQGFEALIEREVTAVFDLASGRVFKTVLLEIEPQHAVLLLMMHHIVADGWSVNILLTDLADLYRQHVTKEYTALPAVAVQYTDYSRWQRQLSDDGWYDSAHEYWVQALDNVPTILALNYDKPRRQLPSYKGAMEFTAISPALKSTLLTYARKQAVTPYMLLLAVFAMVLYRCSGQKDFLIGTPVANRPKQSLHNVVGLFVNTLLMRMRIDPNQDFEGLLKAVKQTALSAYDHQHYPFERLLDALRIERNLAVMPLFQVMFDYQEQGRQHFDLTGIETQAIELPSISAKCDLTFNVVEQDDRWMLSMEYSTDLFEQSSIKQLLSVITTVLEDLAEQPKQCISRIALLPVAIKNRILCDWNATEQAYSSALLPELLSRQAARTPDNIALVYEQQTLSFQQLEQRSNQLANYLRQQGVNPESLVAVCLHRSIELVISLHAIVKAGGAYIPLDPDYPQERLDYTLQNSGAHYCLTQQALAESVKRFSGPFIVLEAVGQAVQQQPVTPPELDLHPDNIVYILYTSGSTGRPKGVANSHGALVNRLNWIQRRFPIGQHDAVLQKTPCSFDVSVWEIFEAPITGAKLVIAEPNGHKDNVYLSRLIQQQHITTLHFVPAMLNVFIDDPEAAYCTSLKRIFCGGEALPGTLQQQVQATLSAQLLNQYGPTEAAIDVSVWECGPDDSGSSTVAIGKPIDNVQLYILDEQLQAVPVGVAGELYIAGVALARGYHNNASLTAERFVPNPFGQGERMYRTGDMCKHRVDGVIDFLGREDGQIKLRGFRVELGEIENVLKQHPDVREAAVKLCAQGQHKRLVAYLVGKNQSVQEHDVKHQIRQLPEYMRPSQYVMLDKLPLTASGKLDRNALKEPEIKSRQHYIAARNDIEQTLVEIWQDVLKLKQIGVTDNYFELGGDSILSIQLVSKAKQAGIALRIEDLFLGQTVETLAQRASLSDRVIADQGRLGGACPLTPIQHYFFERIHCDQHYFNQSVLLEVEAALDQTAMKQAVEHLLNHHDALRLQFKSSAGSGQLYFQDDYDPEAVFQCRSFTGSDDLSAQLADAQAGFKQGEGLLIRVLHFKAEDGLATGRLFIVIHHLAVDGVSWRILLEDLHSAYRQLVERRRVSLPGKTTSYPEWSRRLQGWSSQAGNLAPDTAYWQDYCGQDFFILPPDLASKESITLAETTVKTLVFDRQLSQALMQAPRLLSATVEEVLLAALVNSLWQWQGTHNLSIELEGHGRETLFPDVDVSRTVGWFTSLFPLAVGTAHNSALDAVKSALKQLPHRGLSYGALRYLSANTELKQQLQQVQGSGIRFNYLGRFDSASSDTALMGKAAEAVGEERSMRQLFDLLMDVNCAVYADCLRLDWRYSALQFNQATINQLITRFEDNLRQLLQPLVAKLQSKFPLAGINEQRLQSLPNPHQLEDVYPLSPLQQGLLFHSVYARESSSYLQQISWRFTGELNVDCWREAWRQLIDMHPILRTGFDWQGSEQPLQMLYKQVDLHWQDLNTIELNPEKRQQIMADFLREDRQQPFDTGTVPLHRFSLLDFGSGHFFFVFSHHHILLDGWSLPKLLEDVFKLYAAKLNGQRAQLTPRRPFRDYIEWLAEQDDQAAEQFWRGKLKGFSETNKLAIDQGGEIQTGAALFHPQTVVLDEAQTQAIEDFARQQHVTVNCVMQAAWVILLSRYCNSRDIVFGLTVAGRPAALSGVADMVGLFINTVPVRAQLSPDLTVSQLLQHLFKEHFEREAFSHVQLAKLQPWSDLKGGQGLFDTLFIFENYPIDETLEQKSESLSLDDFKVHEQTDLPLTLLIAPGKQMSITLSYQQQRFNQANVQQLLAHFQQLLTAILPAANRRLTQIELLTVAEQKALQLSNAKAVNQSCLTKAASLHELIERQVKTSDDKVAVQFAQQQLTYRQLDAQANRLAHYLISQGVGRESIVAICMPRCLEMVVALFAVLKAGAAYLPLDLKLPDKRLQFMVEDSGAAVLIGKGPFEFDWPVPVLDMDDPLPSNNHPVSTVPHPDNLAYVIYTSGSTGKPKAVQISHKNIVNFICTMADKPGLTKEDRLLAVTTLAFDIAALELYLPLSVGATVVIADNAQTADGFALKALLQQQAITAMQATPATWRLLLAADWRHTPGFKVLCGGEAFPVNLAKQLTYCADQVWNVYGPTETTVWSSCCQVDGTESVKLGKPLANTRLYVVDESLNLLPANIPGELMIAGAGVARGYRHRAGLTAERFIPDPFTGSGELMYRTGDQVVQHLDGSIEYLGRLDFQAKIRGYRIELGEIESQMEAMAAIDQAVAVVLEDGGNQQLVAYYRGQPVEHSQLREWLSSQLPSYMIPTHFIQLPQFALTHSGKVDRKALPKPQNTGAEKLSGNLPKSALEQQLVAIWQEVLQRGDVGVDDNFFDLGGHSLLLMQVWNVLQRQLDKAVPTVDLFRYPSIRKLAKHLENLQDDDAMDSVKRAEQKAQRQRSGRRKKINKKGLEL